MMLMLMLRVIPGVGWEMLPFVARKGDCDVEGDVEGDNEGSHLLARKGPSAKVNESVRDLVSLNESESVSRLVTLAVTVSPSICAR